MKATKFGKLIRTTRIEKEIMLKDMAEALGMTSAYLSALELGKRALPADMGEKVINYFQFNELESEALNKAIDASQPTLKMDLKNNSSDERELLHAFARGFGQLSEEKRQKLRELIGE